MVMSTSALNQMRRALAHSPLRPVLTSLGVVSLGRRIYNQKIIAGGTNTMKVGGRELVFRVTTDAEIRHLDGQHNEDELMSRIAGALRPGDQFIDVGANIGIVSLLAAKSDSVGVHAFEPEPRNAARLRENISLNAPAHVRVHELGLGDRAGTHEFFIAPETGDGTHSLMASRADGRTPIQIQIDTLDAVVLAGTVPQPSVIKVDVEGAEALVLDGAARTLQSATLREVFLELHPRLWDADSGTSVAGFKDRMAGLGFELVWEMRRGHEVHQHYHRPTQTGA